MAVVWLVAVAPAFGVAPSFTGPSPFHAANQPVSVVAADVNADGRPDLITANYGTNGAGGNTVLINTTPANAATPTFTGPTAFNARNGPGAVVAADVNADGKPDLITANYNTNGASGNTVLINTTPANAATPTFTGPTAFNAGNHPGSVVAADVNADGKPDLISANNFTNGAGGNTVLINTTAAGAGTPTFTGPTAFNAGSGPGSVVAADVNADGKPDLITANLNTNGAGGNTVLINTTAAGAGTPTFSGPTAFNAGDSAASVVAADVNGDAKPDLITANRFVTTGAAGNTVLINTTAAGAGTPTFSGPTPFNTGTLPRSVVAADVNGDAKPDLITANNYATGAGGNTVLINTTPTGAATPAFTGPTAFDAGTNPFSVVAADVNGDAKTDLITANNNTSGAGGNTVLLNTTIGSLPALVRTSTTWFLRGQNGSCCAGFFSYGAKPLAPLMGDWDANGSRTPGTFEAGVFKLNNANDASPADITFTFGDARGFPVAGDFNANGTDDVAVYRNGVWQIRLSDGTILPNFTYGSGSWPATIPISGDWDGNGTDGIGTYAYSSATWNLRHTASAGVADAGSFAYGTANSSYPVVGDWNADGIDTVGHRTGQTWTLTNSNATRSTDVTPFGFGVANDLPLSWHP
jgi:hypothetical protein